MNLSDEAIDALAWMRDNKYHIGEWLPKNAKPEKCTHMKLSGYGYSIKVKADVWVELSGLLEYNVSDRLFIPNPETLRYLEENGK